MQDRQVVSVAPYLDVLYRHWLASVCSVVVGIGLTVFTLVLLPDVYKSTTTVLIEPQQIAQAYVAGSSPSETLNRVKMLNAEALSRSQLEEVISSFNLYPRERAAHEPMDQIVDYMRRHTAVDLAASDDSRGSDRLNSFTLSFEYNNALLAQKVTARLGEIFVNEDLRQRTGQATAASEFLHDQVEIARHQLAEKGDEIKTYKVRNSGSLPADLESNLRELDQLQTQVATTEQSLQNLDLESPENRLAKAKAELLELKARYSDAHPDVIAGEKQVKVLETEQAQDEAAAKSRSTEAISPLQLRVQELRRAVEIYSVRIAETPKHEQELAALNRDQEVLQKNYQVLLNKELDAQLSAQLQERQEGERFRVLDTATLPIKPIRPNRAAIGIMGIVFTVLAAIALPFGIVFTDTSFHDSDELTREYDVPVLVSIPSIENAAGRSERRSIVFRAIAASSVTLTLAGAAIWIYATRIF
jgi:polysaccharide biosynthesis transport protein